MAGDIVPFLAIIRERCGPKVVITDPADIEPWLTDWRGRYHGKAQAILAPASTEDVAAIVGLAAEHRVPLVPQGGNTSMVGGATPPPDGSAVILSLRRMNRIRSISAEGSIAVAESGVILADLHNQAAAIGRRFPLTLGAKGSCTIGGLTATNAGGTQVLRFGTMRSLIAGVEAVLADSSIHSGLSALKKDNRGYNLDELLIGSEGTLAVITAVALKLVPSVYSRAVAWVGVASPHDALSLLRFCEARTDRIEGFELVPADCLSLVLDHIPGTRPPLERQHPWNVLIEATSDREDLDPAELLQSLLAKALDEKLIEDAAIAANEAQAEAFWKLRDGIAEAERADGPSAAHDISVPVSDMPRFIVQASAAVEAAFPGIRASAFGHLGDGNVHFHVRGPEGSTRSWLEDAGPPILRFVDDLVTAAGGSISAEHGIGQMKRGELERLGNPGDLAAMRAIKHALDPLGIMNPGKLVG